jgi:hypothetical protein
MCFSLKVSLAASVGLFLVGVFCLKKNHKKLLAYIPFIFAVQQLAEALVWASFDYSWGARWVNIFSYLFLFFAFVVWPLLIPYSFYQIEQTQKRQKILIKICYIGSIVSIYLFYQLIVFPLNVKIVCSSIEYYSQLVNDNLYLLFTYAFTVMAPCFISTISRAKIFGVALFISWAISCYVYAYAFTSVWCFFAALLSSVIYFLL